MRNKNSGTSRPLEFVHWMDRGGRQTQRQKILADEDMAREMVTFLGLESAHELSQDEPLDPVWNLRESCLSMWAISNLDDREKELANSYLRLDQVAKEDHATTNDNKAIDPTTREWKSI